MNLIHFGGLNCYLCCVLTLAAFLGLRYEDSFATLWPETDFFHDPCHRIFSSKQLMQNLEAMGVRFVHRRCASPEEAEEGLSLCPERAFLILGMDAFFVPWSPVHRAMHDPHYFIAQKEGPKMLRCYDPAYRQKGMWLSHEDILAHARDIGHVTQVPRKPFRVDVSEQARAVMEKHPQTMEMYLQEMGECLHGKREKADALARRTGALICNRRLFSRYLRSFPAQTDELPRGFDEDFFSRWSAVKNGLYKASLTENNESVIAQARDMFVSLLEDEIAVAGEMLAAGSARRSKGLIRAFAEPVNRAHKEQA